MDMAWHFMWSFARQTVLLEVSSLIFWHMKNKLEYDWCFLGGLGTLGRFYAIFDKKDNFCDFLFCFHAHEDPQSIRTPYLLPYLS